MANLAHRHLSLFQIKRGARFCYPELPAEMKLFTSIDDNLNDFNFHSTSFPFLSSNIPSSSAYGFSSHSIYDMPGLALRVNSLF